ncbi:MAG: AAA family ATPase, partial [Deltaproteobacteria bacterium]|nr:AAA family ATPase [Deltaproteobacteria bacterium]
SGSGKSTLVFGVLAPALASLARPGAEPPHGCRELRCRVPVRSVLRGDRHDPVDSGSSMLAGYVGVWDRLRTLFAKTPEARAAGLGARSFSTAVPGGRCETCRGRGVVTIAMDFLPDVTVGCEACGGARFGPAVLAVRLDGLTAAEVLELSVREACERFAGRPAVAAPLRGLDGVGLGYLRLGQPTSSLSGGELQRLRLAAALAAATAEDTVVLLDEPTTGLHHRDTTRLLGALDALVERGCTVIVVEHDLEVIAAADWILDLGPEGGPEGGRLVAQGPPSVVAAADTPTGRALAAWLAGRG